MEIENSKGLTLQCLVTRGEDEQNMLIKEVYQLQLIISYEKFKFNS